MDRYKLKIDLPYLPKGTEYDFEFEEAIVYRVGEDGKPFEYPLRPGLAGYLYLLLTDKGKYFKRVYPSRAVNKGG